MKVNNDILKNIDHYGSGPPWRLHRAYMRFGKVIRKIQKGISTAHWPYGGYFPRLEWLLNSNAEMIISGDLAYILNWETETGI